jgi:hypothetical protein
LFAYFCVGNNYVILVISLVKSLFKIIYAVLDIVYNVVIIRNVFSSYNVSYIWFI